ncbi:hypothetical protein SLA2020_188810 [Shorea laevis]
MKTDFLPSTGGDSNDDDLESWSLGDDLEGLESIGHGRNKVDWSQEIANQFKEDDHMDEPNDVTSNGNNIKRHTIQTVNLLRHEEGGISCMGKGEAWAADETHRNKLNDNTAKGAPDNLEKPKDSFNAYDSSGDWNEKNKSKQAEDSFNAYDNSGDWNEKDKSK